MAITAVCIDHIDMVVKDVDEYVQYLEKLGFAVVGRRGKAVEMQLPAGGPRFELFPPTGDANPGVNHIAFQVEDLPGFHQELVGKGVTFEGHYQDAPQWHPTNGRLLASGRDPNGFRFQLIDVKRKEV